MFGLLRTILAINVVAYHILKVPAIGPYAVYSFFILSGFLMTMIMQKTYGYTLFGFKNYTSNRLLRLYPIYWILMIVTLLVIYSIGNDITQKFHPNLRIPTTWKEFLANTLMIFPGLMEYPTRILPATWALTIELFFYLLIGLGISKNRKITLVWFISSIIFTFYMMFSTKAFAYDYSNLLTASLPFSLGAFIYHYREVLFSLLKRSFPLKISLPLFILNLVVSLSLPLLENDSLVWKLDFFFATLNIALTACLILQLQNIKTNKKWMKLDKKIGDYSYPIYIFHWSAALIVFWLLTVQNIQISKPNNDIVIFLGALVISYIIGSFVNKFNDKYIERLRKKNRTVKDAGSLTKI
ncbi:MAG: acyltransferase [Colwellia sp.]|nr:acyltransferase [Colwellia sp.]